MVPPHKRPQVVPPGLAGMNQRESANLWFADGSPSRGHNLHTDFDTANVTQNAAQLRRRNPHGMVQPIAGSSTITTEVSMSAQETSGA